MSAWRVSGEIIKNLCPVAAAIEFIHINGCDVTRLGTAEVTFGHPNKLRRSDICDYLIINLILCVVMGRLVAVDADDVKAGAEVLHEGLEPRADIVAPVIDREISARYISLLEIGRNHKSGGVRLLHAIVCREEILIYEITQVISGIVRIEVNVIVIVGIVRLIPHAKILNQRVTVRWITGGAAHRGAAVELGCKIIEKCVGVVTVQDGSTAITAIAARIGRRGGRGSICPLWGPGSGKVHVDPPLLRIPDLPWQDAPVELILLRLQEPPNCQQAHPLGSGIRRLINQRTADVRVAFAHIQVFCIHAERLEGALGIRPFGKETYRDQ